MRQSGLKPTTPVVAHPSKRPRRLACARPGEVRARINMSRLDCSAAVLIVVRRGDAILAIQETNHAQAWFPPAGGVEIGETLEDAARREAKEEAGVDVSITGVLAIDNHLRPDKSLWIRVVYLATVAPEAQLKDAPDEHSLKARWLTKEDLDTVPLRGDELRRFLAMTSEIKPTS